MKKAKKRFFKKSLAIFLVVLLLLGTFNFSIFAAEAGSASTEPKVAANVVETGQAGASVQYTLYDNGELHFSGTDRVELMRGLFQNDLRIQKIVFEEGITELPQYEFYGCTNLKTMEIPASAEWFSTSVFRNCMSLENVMISPNNPNYKSVDGVMYNSDQSTLVYYPVNKPGTSFVVPNGTYTIDYSAFESAQNLTNIILPESLQGIYNGAFRDCKKLTTLSLPKSLTDFSDDVTAGCTALTKIEVDAQNPRYQSIDGVLFSKDGTQLIRYPSNKSGTNYAIPQNVTRIGQRAFEGAQHLTSIQFPDGIQYVGREAFFEAKLLSDPQYQDASGAIYLGNILVDTGNPLPSEYTVKEGTTVLAEGAGERNYDLVTLHLPQSLLYINDSAFSECETLANIQFGNQIQSVGYGAFERTAYINDVKNWENGNALYIGSVLVQVKDTATGDFIVKDGTTTIGDRAFVNCEQITTVTLPTGVKSIGEYAFENCGITTISLPNGLESLGTQAFSSANNLSELRIPKTVKYIGKYAFTWPTNISVYKNSYAEQYCKENSIWAQIIYADLEDIKSVGVSIAHLRQGIDTLPTDPYVTVTLKNGKVVTKTLRELKQYFATQNIHIEWPAAQANVVGQHTATIYFGETPYTFTYVVEENPYTALRILKTEKLCLSNSNWGYKFIYELSRKDGTKEIGYYGYDKYSEDGVQYVDLGFQPSCSKIGTWQVGKDNVLEITIAGQTAQALFEVYEKNPNYEYSFIEDNIIITYANVPNDAVEFEVPKTVDGYNVIGISSLDRAGTVKTLIIPDHIRFITNTLLPYSSVTTVRLGKNVQSLDYSMFTNSTLQEIVVSPENPYYTSFEGALYTKDMKTLVAYPLGKTGPYHVPKQTENIDIFLQQEFRNVEVIYSDNSTFYVVQDGVTYTKDMKTIVACDKTKAGTYVMPQTVTSIKDGAFRNCENLTEITFAPNIQEIVYGAFESCYALEKITLPQNLITLDDAAFRFCNSLKEITLPDSLRSLGEETFLGCEEIETLNIGASIEQIPSSLFRSPFLKNILVSDRNPNYTAQDNVLFNKDKTTIVRYPKGIVNTEYTVPNTVQSIEEYAFSECGLTNIILPQGLKTIKNGAFDSCANITSIVLPQGLEHIYPYAFAFCSNLQKIEIPDSVRTLGYCAFMECPQLNTVKLSNQMLRLAESTFRNCTHLKEITIPASVQRIERGAFASCSALENVILENKNVHIEADAFYDTPCESKFSHGGAFTNGRNVKGAFTVPDNIVTICYGAFEYNTDLTELTLPNTVTTIEGQAFKSCSALEKVDFGKGIKTIGASAFYSATALTDVVLPNTVESIGDSCFSFSGMQNLQLPEKYISIGTDAFRETPWLKIQPNGPIYIAKNLYVYKGAIKDYETVQVENGTIQITGKAFANQTNLKGILLPESLEHIGAQAFMGCKNLQNVVLPNALKTIGHDAFYDCESLTSITIPASVISIGTDAFSRCVNLTDIYVDPNNPNYTSVDGVLYNKDMTKLLFVPNQKTTLHIPAATESIEISNYGPREDPYYYKSVLVRNDALSSIQVDANNKAFSSIDGVLYNATGTELLYCPKMKKGHLNIAAKVNSIYEYAFEDTSLTSVCVQNPNVQLDGAVFSSVRETPLYLYGYGNSTAKIYAGYYDQLYISMQEVVDKTSKVSVGATEEKMLSNDAMLQAEVETKTDGTHYLVSMGAYQPTEKELRVVLPIPEKLQNKDVQVYFKDASGRFIDMHAALQNNQAIFSCKELGEFIITEDFLDVTLGDLSGDGICTITDYKDIIDAIAGDTLANNRKATYTADLNKDGAVDAFDAALLDRILPEEIA